ncbi:uncharacterized protein PITG_05473 [Phytophthora infestans T30-4]|uniref:Uncharacterized protein n=1 Tax=Phytophthora infestans (strain T30-4) TaxID=403677 RepID=D0N2W6_PHYIT|nr:uncharacterized protein PITG_05473 [Phytophthora infestans T30-4]EEY69258.1 hypothetical protein PITG_05473 [Phytophthora infestans T30-4]|eukprot:XP_002999112.1 hypothetical protein PITG_05473 [Phytophthora infestans T30-4]
MTQWCTLKKACDCLRTTQEIITRVALLYLLVEGLMGDLFLLIAQEGIIGRLQYTDGQNATAIKIQLVILHQSLGKMEAVRVAETTSEFESERRSEPPPEPPSPPEIVAIADLLDEENW